MVRPVGEAVGDFLRFCKVDDDNLGIFQRQAAGVFHQEIEKFDLLAAVMTGKGHGKRNPWIKRRVWCVGWSVCN